MTNCLNRGDNTFVMLKWAEFNHKKMPCKCDLSLAVRLKYAAHISSFLWLCFSKEKKRTAKYLCMKMWLLMQKKAPGWPDRQCSELDMDGIDRSDERPIPTCPLSGPWLIYNPPPPLIPTSPPHTASLLPAPPPLSLYPCHSPLAPPRRLMQSVTNPECFFPPIQTQRQHECCCWERSSGGRFGRGGVTAEEGEGVHPGCANPHMAPLGIHAW